MGKAESIKLDFMTKGDIDQVLAIEEASFSMPWSRNLFLSEFRSQMISRLIVALADKPERLVLGFTVFWLVEDEMHILNLAVKPEFRRKGIARNLVLAALRRGHEQGAKRAYLEVRLSNVAAQKLYSALGFTGAGVRREYYDSPVEDAVLMTLEEGPLQGLIDRLKS
ncbi:MAG TPA: ribosomal protein S18-alanine N-acetyltransferase [Nitrospirota bacterium]|nr:ribosomal protein S18-alanine N-acetyltransferase [Nitrospirota bacterium]